MLKLFFNKSFTAVDIGAHSIKAARFKNKKNNLILINSHLEYLPYQTIQDEKIVNMETVTDKLDTTLKNINYKKSNKLITTIPVENVIIRKLELPVMDTKELEESLKWEAEDFLPFSVENATLGFNVISRGEEKMVIQLVATLQEVVENYQKPLLRNNYNPSVINVQPMALISLLEYQNIIEGPVGIVDIGASRTKIVIGDKKYIYLSRNIDIGGNDFTELIMEDNHYDYKEAEEFKKNNNLDIILNEKNNYPEDEEEISDTSKPNSMDETNTTDNNPNNKFIKSLSENLLSEIEKSLDYYYRSNQGSNISDLYITGGTAEMKGIHSLLNNKLDYDIYQLNPFQDINNEEPIQNHGAFAVVLGLAAGEVLTN